MSNPIRRVAMLMAAISVLFSPSSVTTQTSAARKPSPLRKADPATRHRVNATGESYGKLPLGFEINRGQAGGDVRFLSRGADYSLLLKSNEAELTVRNGEKSARVGMKILGANPSPRIEGVEEQPGKSNYLIGNDPAKWRTDVANYARVRYTAVYPGIDLVFYGNQRQLEYDFIVHPGARPGDIRLAFEGADQTRIESNGDLMLAVNGREIRQRKPVAYQTVKSDRREIASRYVVNGGNEVSFNVGEYDRNQPLVIDPVMLYSTAGIGGASIAVDSAGNACNRQHSFVRFPLVPPIATTERRRSGCLCRQAGCRWFDTGLFNISRRRRQGYGDCSCRRCTGECLCHRRNRV